MTSARAVDSGAPANAAQSAAEGMVVVMVMSGSGGSHPATRQRIAVE